MMLVPIFAAKPRPRLFDSFTRAGNITHADVALSNGDRTATLTNIAAHRLAGVVNDKNYGRQYWEMICDAAGSAAPAVGVCTIAASPTNYLGSDAFGWGYHASGHKAFGGSLTAGFAAWTTGDVISVAYDWTAQKLWFAKNGAWQGSGDPAAGSNEAFAGVTGTSVGAALSMIAAASTAQFTLNAGNAPFAYTVPAGFEAGIFR